MEMLDRIDISDKFAKMWRTSREDAGKSQDYMAKALGVSKKTIQNWEQGLSCPSQSVGFEWFKILGIAPLPYYLEILYPGINHENDQEVTESLKRIIEDLTPDIQKKLLYILTANHGSSVVAIIDMMTAHLQTPLRDRVNIAQSVYTNYEIAQANNTVKHPDLPQPNAERLHNAIESGKQAVKEGLGDYFITKENL